MSEDMGTIRVSIEIQSPSRPGTRIEVGDVLVATGAELSSVPAAVLESLGIERRKVSSFRHADGTVIQRMTGFVIIRAGGTETIDEVMFGEPGDLLLLGARTLVGLNVRVDPVTKRLVDAGPAPAAIGSIR